MAYFNEFPHTRVYDDDLGWLIENFKKLANDFESLRNQVQELQELYDTVPDVIQAAINNEIAKMQATLEAELAKINDALDSQLAQVNALLKSYTAEFEVIKNTVLEMEQHVADVKALAVTMYINGKIYTDSQIESVMRYIDYTIANLSKKFPLILDPSDGKLEDVQTVIDHIYHKFSPGIRVEDFDALQIKVQDFDAMMIPVKEFDENAPDIFQHRRYAYMISPFTGEYVPISEVVNMLYDLHRHGVTVADFDEAQIPVELFDNKMIEVVTYGTTSEWFEELKEEMA